MSNPFAQQAAPQAPAANPFGGGQAAPQQSAPVAPEAPAQAANPFGGQAPQQPAPQTPAAAFPPAAPRQAPAPAASPFGGAANDPFGAPGTTADAFVQPAGSDGVQRPKWRDLENRLLLLRVTERDRETEAYDGKGTQLQHVADVAVLDGALPLMASAAQGTDGETVVYSETLPATIDEMFVGSVGLKNRLKRDVVLGRLVFMPKPGVQTRPDFKALAASAPGATAPQVFAELIRRDQTGRLYGELKTSCFWSLEAFTDQDAALARAFLAANPRFLG